LPISRKIKISGKIIFVFTLFASLLVIFCAIAAYSSGSKIPKPQLPFFFALLLLLLISGITAIANSVFFSRSLRLNKTIVNKFINDIGEQA